MKTLRSFVEGKWVEGREPFATLVNPATEEPLARTSTNGIDFAAAVEFSRERGGPALRELTFSQRGELLKAWSKALHAARDELIALAMQNGGNTRSDAKFDVDGAIGTIAHYAGLGAQLGSLRALRDGEAVQLGRTARYAASISGSRATASPCTSTPSTSPPGGPARKRPALSWRECR